MCSTQNNGAPCSRSRSGAARRMRSSLWWDRVAVPYSAQRPRHSVRAAVLFSLTRCQEERLRSWLEWFETEAWTAAKFWRLHMRRKRSMARPRRLNGRCEFRTRLLSHLPVCCLLVASSSRRAARYEAKRSATISLASPWRFISFLRNFHAARLFLRFVTTASSASLPLSTARQR